MNGVMLLRNTIMEYPWGSREAIAGLMGQKSPSDQPQAELWMGAHSRAPSMVVTPSGEVPLPDLIDSDPDGLLGKNTSHSSDGKLPFLFKILAAAEPLSIQVHPDMDQARAGFEREQRLGIPLDAENRNYRDRNHKPEILCAMTPFWALKGFRDPGEIFSLLRELHSPTLDSEMEVSKDKPDGMDFPSFYEKFLKFPAGMGKKIIREVVEGINRTGPRTEAHKWLLSLHDFHPDDVSVLHALILNLVILEPGEALFAQAGELHAYLRGTGVELMANSDNVLRGGLTSKHMDIPELLRVLKFMKSEIRILRPRQLPSGEQLYDCPVREFLLSSLEVRGGKPYSGARQRSIEIWITIKGAAKVTAKGTGTVTLVRQGQSFLIPASVPAYTIEGEAYFFRASVPAS